MSEVAGARFSPDRTFRYSLFRLTEHAVRPVTVTEGVRRHRRVVFVGLNPSTADEVVNDATVRRCVGYATRWRFEEMVMLNAFAFRATNPRRLREAEDPIGPENDHWIEVECASAQLVICCWGNHALWHPKAGHPVTRQAEVRFAIEQVGARLHVLGMTRLGAPKHPLYLRADLKPEPWEG